jgi:glycosyltransferase involved in cell wall biosynthesis
MKVVLVVGDFPPVVGGLSDYTALLAQDLARLGIHVTVLTTKIEDQADRSVVLGVEIRRVMSRWRLSEIGSILRIIDELGPATIVSLMYGDSTTRRRPLVNLLPFLLRLLRPKCHVVVNIHEFRTQRTFWRIWAIPMIMTSHGMVFVDPPDKESLIRWTRLKRPKMVCIPIAPNILPVPVTNDIRRVCRQRLGMHEDIPIITFFGGMTTQKALFDLLEAMNNLRRDAVPGCLLLIGWFPSQYTGGSHYEAQFREALRDGLSAGWIKLVESCPSEEVSEYLHATDLIVLPFVRGARSNNGSLLAALAHGLPVLSTCGVDTPEGFDQEYGVALVPAGNPAALSGRLKEILLSDEEKKRLRARALLAAKAFSWETIARTTATFYGSFVANGGE